MTRNTISTLFPIREGSHFVPLHSPDSADSLIFSHQKAGSAVDPEARVLGKFGMTDALMPECQGVPGTMPRVPLAEKQDVVRLSALVTRGELPTSQASLEIEIFQLSIWAFLTFVRAMPMDETIRNFDVGKKRNCFTRAAGQTFCQQLGDMFIAHPGVTHSTGAKPNPENQHLWLGVRLADLGPRGSRLARQIRRRKAWLLTGCQEAELLMRALIGQGGPYRD